MIERHYSKLNATMAADRLAEVIGCCDTVSCLQTAVGYWNASFFASHLHCGITVGWHWNSQAWKANSDNCGYVGAALEQAYSYASRRQININGKICWYDLCSMSARQ